MITGTHDFIDGAVDSLKQGGHPFALVAYSRNAKGDIIYSVRAGVYDANDKRVLHDLLPELSECIREVGL